MEVKVEVEKLIAIIKTKPFINEMISLKSDMKKLIAIKF